MRIRSIMCHETAESGLHQTYSQGLDAVLQRLAPLMVGALTLARATRGDALSDEMLDAARTFLTSDNTITRR
ncbi:hypothetical protein ACXPVS_06260 [Pseudomonas sp. Ma2-10]